MAGIHDSDDDDQGYDGEQMRGQSHPGEAIDVLSRHGSQGGNDTERRIAGLVRTIEGEIIPRLMLAHAARGQALVSASGAPSSPIDPQHVDTLLRSVMAEDTASALQLVRSLAASGVSLEAIFLSVFVLLSQNRQAAKDRVRSDIEYDVNLKAELEIVNLHEKMDRLTADVLKHLEELRRDTRVLRNDR